MKIKKKLLFFVIAFLFFVCSAALAVPQIFARAETDGAPAARPRVTIDTNYWFQTIDVSIEVRNDKSFFVREELKVGFLKDGVNTGIIRDIQRVSKTTRVINGRAQSGRRYLAGLSGVEATIDGAPALVTQGYYSQGEFYSVKMQKPDQSYFGATDQSNKTGYHVFALSYVYDLSDDKAAGYDDFTFDILGYAMAHTRVFRAEITFPTGTVLNDVSFRTNKKAEWIPDEQNYEYARIRNNVISVRALPEVADKGYTVQVLLPEGYFGEARITQFWYYWLFLALAVCAVAGSVAIIVKFTDRKPVETVAVRPPEGMRALRCSAVWHGGAKRSDVAAVIAQWADEGLVRIERDGKRDLTVTKLKEPDASVPREERKYFQAMFPQEEGGEVFSTKATRQRTENPMLLVKRSVRMSAALRAAAEEADRPDPLCKGIKKARMLSAALSVVPAAALIVYLCVLSRAALPLFFLVFIAAGTFAGACMVADPVGPIGYVIPAAFLCMPLGALYALFYIPLYDYAALFWIAPAAWLTSFIGMHFLKRRSPEAQKSLGELRGVKRFLLTAELSRIEMLFQDDPDYFSHIVPYCLIMKISDKVARRFAPLKISMPDWAQGVSSGGFSSLARSLSSSSGGGSHGGGGGSGGSSGGGGGGGGSRGC